MDLSALQTAYQLRMSIPGKRKRGRPHKSCEHTVKEDKKRGNMANRNLNVDPIGDGSSSQGLLYKGIRSQRRTIFGSTRLIDLLRVDTKCPGKRLALGTDSSEKNRLRKLKNA
jgi:hypothetical protein